MKHISQLFNRQIFLMIQLLIISFAMGQTPSITGFVRYYNGVLTQGKNEYSILQNTVDINLEHGRGDFTFLANPVMYHYPDRPLNIDLREAYADIYFDNIDLRIGKQQIIWGKADGVFITDIISPKDLSEFLLPDFEEIRIGVNAVKADYYIGNHTLELVWLPVFEPTRLPAPSSIWFPAMEFPVTPTFDDSRREIKPTLGNSELFAKYAAITSAIDFELMAGYAWDDDPAMHISKTIDPETQQLRGLTVRPRHHRLSIAGGSFSTSISGVILRGEAAYYNGKRFGTTKPLDDDAIVKEDYIHYLIGADATLWDMTVSGQFIQQAVLDYDPALTRDEFENTMTVLLRQDFLRETLTVDLFSYIGFNSGDALIRPHVYYDLTDGVELLFGANIFSGSEGRFGQYDNNDMLYVKLKYSF